MAVEQITVGDDEADLRLDRWFKRHYPQLPHGRLEKLLRTGQIRIDGGRAKANQRLAPGQIVRVPPLAATTSPAQPHKSVVSERDAAFVKSLVLYKDDELIALNKPAGLAVQGGTKTARHLDGMLDALRFDAKERPRLVHRLDRDTSGIMIVARTANAAARLAKAFQSRDMEKIYWALVVGYPRHPAGTISAALIKGGAPGQERMKWDDEGGKKAVTDYRVVATAAEKITWLELSPRTGRTHQLRAHCALIGTPIIGDAKYPGTLNPDPDQRVDLHDGLLADVADRLCLHAHALTIERPGKKPLTLKAPLPSHMASAFDALGFDQRDGDS
jgi:23S rRNA pseudouridine955/2504/2580 synthase